MNRSLRSYRGLALLGLAMLVTLGGCLPPPVMISNYPLGNRVVRFSMQRSVQVPGTFNLFLEACTLQPNAQASDCRTQQVLDNVSPRTIY